jgi:DHA2 family multidrug resistance protein-like MFS transporter
VTGSVVFSLGLAPVFTLATDLIVGAAPPERAGAASAVSETSSEFGGALGIAVLGSVGAAVYRGQITDAIPAGAAIPPEAAATARDTLGGALAVAAHLPGRFGAELVVAGRAAFIHGLQLTFATSTAVAIGIAVLVVALLRQVGAGSEHERRPEPSQDGPCCAAKVGVVKVSAASGQGRARS